MSSTCKRFAIAMALASLGSAAVAAQERVFPDVRSFERPQASPRVYGVVGRLLTLRRGESRFGSGREAEVALGENFPIFAFGAWPVTVGFGTEVYGRFSLEDSRTALISNDWMVAVNATADFGRWAATVELAHESSHLGDEYKDRFDERRVDWTRAILVGWVNYTTGHWRFSGSASQVLLDELGLARHGGAAGIDYRGTWGGLLDGVLRPIGGLYAEADAATDWRVSTSARLGVAVSAAGRGREFAVSLIAHDGLSTQRQFFGRPSQYLGFEIRFDL